MIELNLTYEESKQILELGYDFSKVCVEWQCNFYPPGGNPDKGKITKWFTLGENLVNPTLLGMLTQHQVDILKTYTVDLEEAIADVRNYKAGDEYIPLIPIIPKAALEECLPDYLRYEDKHTWAGHTSICLAYGTGEDLTIENYTTEHESAYEAFMWVHEHYPEELKAKFNEVMG